MSQLSEPIGAQPCLLDQNFRLRQFKTSDSSELSNLHKDPLLTRFLLDDVSLQDSRTASIFAQGMGKFYRENPGLGIWAFDRLIVRYTREQLLQQGAYEMMQEAAVDALLEPIWQLQGWFNLTPVPDYPDQIELGSRLHRGSWGQRIACTVGQELVEYAFRVLSVPRLYLHCHPENTSALYCAAYLGFDSPKPVTFLGLPALKLSVPASHLENGGDVSDSERRRTAVRQVRLWTQPNSVATT